jgi:hypothetical protein
MSTCVRYFIHFVWLIGSASAQTYTFLRVAGETAPRPDGLGPIALNVSTRPAIEGNYVVFRDGGFFGSNGLQTIWSHNLVDGTTTRLVDLKTAVPGGTGNFSDLFFDSSPILKNGIVTFLARDSKAPPSNRESIRSRSPAARSPASPTTIPPIPAAAISGSSTPPASRSAHSPPIRKSRSTATTTPTTSVSTRRIAMARRSRELRMCPIPCVRTPTR